MKEKLISPEEVRCLHPLFQGKYGDELITLASKVAGLQYANQLYDNSKHLTGVAFCTNLLDELEIKRTVKNSEILDEYKKQPFITVSNHPYGHIDGIALIETIGSRSPQFKVMVNFILGLIDTMEENFIIVNPNEIVGGKGITLNGIKKCFKHLKGGHPLGFFPAGAVSNLYFRNGKLVLEDRKWQTSVIKLIQKVKQPVIPIHVSGKNSFSFYASKIFGWKTRNFRLCHELYNKKGKEIVLTVGNPILPEKIKQHPDPEELGKLLKAETYALG